MEIASKEEMGQFQWAEQFRNARRKVQDLAKDLEALRPFQDVASPEVFYEAWSLAMLELRLATEQYVKLLKSQPMEHLR